jgi:ParB family chromosome partitioning protein
MAKSAKAIRTSKKSHASKAKKTPAGKKQRQAIAPEAAAPVIQKLPLSLIYANEEQARKIFDEAKLHELASSIRAEGLISPIIVRPDGTGKFMIVAGERRFRACKIVELQEIDVIVKELGDDSLTYQMIIENLQRENISPLEEARSWQKAMDDHNLTAEQFAAKVGIQQPFRVHDRLTLLNLKPEYQAYLEQGYLNPTQAFYLGKVSREHQTPFWNLIKNGKIDNSELAAVAQSFIDAASQDDMFPEAVLTEEEVRAVKGMREHIAAMYATLNRFFNKDGEMDIVKKIDRNLAAGMADDLELIIKVATQARRKLQEPVVQKKIIDELAGNENDAAPAEEAELEAA